jgi:hypothetical protein
MYFVFIYENRKMKPVEITQKKGGREEEGRGRMMDGINLT